MSEVLVGYLSNLAPDPDLTPWSGYMPQRCVDPASGTMFYDLHPVLRALLIADGTVTMAIEAIYREPIKVETAAQRMLRFPESLSLLETKGAYDFLYREVELLGHHSGKHYVKAFSLLKLESLSQSLRERLLSKEVGMGVVLRSATQGSFRQVVHIGMGDLGLNQRERYVHRTYSVSIANVPAILITEVFDLLAFKDGYK